MRIAMLDPSLFTLPYDVALAQGLEAAGHQVVLHGRVPGTDDNAADGVDLRPSFYRLSGALPRLPGPLRLAAKGTDHAWSMARLSRRLRRDPPDVIHAQWLPLPAVDRLFLPALHAVAPLVLTVHDTDPFNGNPAGRLQRLGAHAALQAFDRLIVHTAQGHDRLVAQGIAPGRIVTLPHGLLGRRPPPAPPDAMDGPITFILFGKIKPYKGADLLIDAFGRLPAPLRAQARVRIVGKPYMDLAPLRTAAAPFGASVVIEDRFVGDDEVPALFGPGTVATFPYREIEASGVLGLAIQQGRPLLATALGGFREAVRQGTDGLLVPPGDPGALAAAMDRFLSDRAFAAAAAAAVRQAAAVAPSWEEIARRTAAVYEAVRSSRAARRAAPRRRAETVPP